MGTEEPRWFYVGNGQLRLKDGEDWTDEYQTIESRRAQPRRQPLLWSLTLNTPCLGRGREAARCCG